MKFFLALLIIIFIYITQSRVLLAYDVPSFTSCINPQGDIKASYETGTHGIVGSSNTYTGQDTVYSVSGNALTQCFCSTDGSGIQTNWWKLSSLTDVEINSLKSQGWIYVPSGALWGLEETAYLARNSDFSCKSTLGVGGGGGGGGGVLGSDGTSSNNSANNSSGGSIEGISAGVGQVLGLASTGNSKFLLSSLFLSGICLFVGLFFRKRTKNISK